MPEPNILGRLSQGTINVVGFRKHKPYMVAVVLIHLRHALVHTLRVSCGLAEQLPFGLFQTRLEVLHVRHRPIPDFAVVLLFVPPPGLVQLVVHAEQLRLELLERCYLRTMLKCCLGKDSSQSPVSVTISTGRSWERNVHHGAAALGVNIMAAPW